MDITSASSLNDLRMKAANEESLTDEEVLASVNYLRGDRAAAQEKAAKKSNKKGEVPITVNLDSILSL